MRKKINILAWDFLGFLLRASTLSFSSKACKRFLREAKQNPYDIIIVPGVPFKNGKWDPIMKARIYWAKYLYINGIAKNLMFSGAAVYTPYNEARIMALYAEALGIPRKNIFEELLAEHSTENIFYSWQYARKLGFDRIALASDPFQTRMLRKFVQKKVSPEIGLLPVVFEILRKMDAEMTDPEIDHRLAVVPEFISIRKRHGTKKRLEGTRGFSIDPELYS